MSANPFSKKISIFTFLISIASYSQNNIVASGGDAVGSAGTSSYSVGQISYSEQTGNNGYLIQGNQQPFEVIALSNDEFNDITVAISLYPNPTQNSIHLVFSEKYNIADTCYELFDTMGKRISDKIKVSDKDQIVPLDNLPSGFYLLYVSKNNKVEKSFKILKNN